MARNFNGTSDFMSAATNLASNRQLSIGLWVNWTTFSVNDGLGFEYSTNLNTNNGSFIFDINESGGSKPLFGWSDASGNKTEMNFPRWGAGVFHHILLLLDTTQAGAASIPAAYVDGVSQTLNFTLTNSSATALTNYTLYFMSRAGTTLFGAGSIVDFAIWNTLLTSGNATSLANGVRPVNVNSANLIDWWPVDGYASPETDLGSNAVNASVTGTSRVLGPPPLWRVSHGV